MRFLSLFLIIALVTACKKEKNRLCHLYDGSVGYTVGTIDRMNKTPLKATYIYTYQVNGTNYEGKEKSYDIGQESSIIGKSYVVVYALEDPSNSDLNMKFFIESDTDFNDFLSEYQNNPPPQDFPRKCK